MSRATASSNLYEGCADVDAGNRIHLGRWEGAFVFQRGFWAPSKEHPANSDQHSQQPKSDRRTFNRQPNARKPGRRQRADKMGSLFQRAVSTHRNERRRSCPQQSELQSDSPGDGNPLPMSFPHSDAPWAKELQVSTVRSVLTGVRVANKSASLFWLFTCDSADTSPTASSACALPVPANGEAFLDWRDAARLMDSGIYLAASSDPVTKTLIAATDAFFECAWSEFPLPP